MLDGNDAVLGKLIGYDNYFYYTLLSPTGGYFYSVGIDGTFPIDQIYWTGSGCAGTPYLNDGWGGGQKRNGKLVSYSGATHSLYTIDPSSMDELGVSTSVGITAASIENPTCMASGGTVGGWKLVATTPAAIGINASGNPLQVAVPVKLQ